jgi:hypothetical protein
VRRYSTTLDAVPDRSLSTLAVLTDVIAKYQVPELSPVIVELTCVVLVICTFWFNAAALVP